MYDRYLERGLLFSSCMIMQLQLKGTSMIEKIIRKIQSMLLHC
jgi:hypothetical protein